MKKLASFTLHIPTMGYPMGKPTRDLDKIIRHLLDARRNAHDDDERDYCNTLLEQAYKDKYDDL